MSKSKPKKKTRFKKGVESKGRVTFRVLAKQALSIDVSKRIEDLTIQGVKCRIALKPAYLDRAKQRELGGSTLAVEFEAARDVDMFAAARDGFELIEDFLSAITVVSGATFTPCELVQVARLAGSGKENCRFIQFLPLSLNHWHERISDGKLMAARKLLAHWDGLENGHRLRRAARSYRYAAGNVDDVSAFQEAYIGLEAMEPPLAKLAGLTPGTEEVKGSCEKCGNEFVRKRTALVGVRAFVHGDVVLENADDGRKSDWKLLNTLRNQLMHGLVDEDELEEKPLQALISSMHYLHHAICACSHSSELGSEQYRLARGGVEFILVGDYTVSTWPDLGEWSQIMETTSFAWTPHPEYELVPEMNFRNPGLPDLQVGVGKLTQPLSVATMNDIGRVRFEHD